MSFWSNLISILKHIIMHFKHNLDLLKYIVQLSSANFRTVPKLDL